MAVAGGAEAWDALDDVGPAIQAAIDYAVDLLNSPLTAAKSATVTLPVSLPSKPGDDTTCKQWNSEVVIADPRLSLVGLSSAVCGFFCNGGAGKNATAAGVRKYLVCRPGKNAFGVEFSGKIGGFKLRGSDADYNCGFYWGDVVGLTLDDFITKKFTGAGSVGNWAHNIGYFTERNILTQIHFDYCTVGFRMTGGGTEATRSFGFNRFLSLVFNTYPGQTAWEIEGNAFFYESWIFASCNAEVGPARYIHVRDYAQCIRNTGAIVGEQTSGSPGVAIELESDATWWHFQGPLHTANLKVVDNSGSNWVPRLFFSAGWSLNEANQPVISPGKLPLGEGTVAAFNALPSKKEGAHAGFGHLIGPGIESPYVEMLDGPGNIFGIYRRTFQGDASRLTKVGGITREGDYQCVRDLDFIGIGGIAGGIIPRAHTIAGGKSVTTFKRLVSGLLSVRDVTGGVSALYFVDEAGGVTKLAGPAQFVTGVAGMDQIGIAANASATTISNGYPVARDVAYFESGFVA